MTSLAHPLFTGNVSKYLDVFFVYYLNYHYYYPEDNFNK